MRQKCRTTEKVRSCRRESWLGKRERKNTQRKRRWKTSRWFCFDDRKSCNWIILIFKPRSGAVHPDLALHARKNSCECGGAKPKDAPRYPGQKLNRGFVVGFFENNWSFILNPDEKHESVFAPVFQARSQPIYGILVARQPHPKLFPQPTRLGLMHSKGKSSSYGKSK